MSADSERISELNAKIAAIQAKTARDSQEALDFAHIARVCATERKDKHGS
jgi:hypothetical protein